MASQPRISVVNDTETFLQLIRDALQDRYDVSTFDGLHLTVDALAASRPDLLIIDLVMRARELSGWDIVQLCRAEPGLSQVPIIVCSADLGQLRQRAVELAAIPSLSVLEKPFGLSELDAAVEAALETPEEDGAAAS